MLRVHSILYLQHVWTRPSSNVEEVEPEPQIEEEQPVQTQEPEITVEATPEPEEPAVDNTEHEESEQEHVVSEEEQQQQPVLVEEPELIRSEAEQKRDSKLSTFSKELSPIAEEEQGRTNDSDIRAVPPPPILANSSSITAESGSLPPTPVSTQPSRSKQFKDIIPKRKTMAIGKKLKRAFSVSSSTSSKRKSM
ncbi:hypothetical protein VTP01DRAFT_5312 [Rhizomucor pusillus]|uniref:uncharacterized protein n=1 Tax=Rhizomucor pusillus TaxID=4840 RepID=UPI0037447FD4